MKVAAFVVAAALMLLGSVGALLGVGEKGEPEDVAAIEEELKEAEKETEETKAEAEEAVEDAVEVVETTRKTEETAKIQETAGEVEAAEGEKEEVNIAETDEAYFEADNKEYYVSKYGVKVKEDDEVKIVVNHKENEAMVCYPEQTMYYNGADAEAYVEEIKREITYLEESGQLSNVDTAPNFSGDEFEF